MHQLAVQFNYRRPYESPVNGVCMLTTTWSSAYVRTCINYVTNVPYRYRPTANCTTDKYNKKIVLN